MKKFMVWYLRRKGFVVFHLEECARFCVNDRSSNIANYCWLQLYEEEMLRQKTRKYKEMERKESRTSESVEEPFDSEK